MPTVQVKFIGFLAETIGEKITWVKIEENASIKNLIDELDRKLAGRVKKAILDPETEKIKIRIKILLNGKNIDFCKGLESNLYEGSIVTFIPPVGGG